jgi:hypothetical protein
MATTRETVSATTLAISPAEGDGAGATAPVSLGAAGAPALAGDVWRRSTIISVENIGHLPGVNARTRTPHIPYEDERLSSIRLRRDAGTTVRRRRNVVT